MRLALFTMIIISVVGQLLVPGILFVIWYLYRYTSYELIVLAVLIDGYTGAFHDVPLYTITTTCVVLVAEWVRPHFLFYTE